MKFADTLRGLGATVTELGLDIEQNVTEANLEKIGRFLQDADDKHKRSWNFVWGDWYNAIPDTYGARRSRVVILFGEGPYARLRNLGSICKRYPRPRRKPGVPWWVYEELAREPERIQDTWLARWGVKKFSRKEIRESRFIGQSDLNIVTPAGHCASDTSNGNTVTPAGHCGSDDSKQGSLNHQLSIVPLLVHETTSSLIREGAKQRGLFESEYLETLVAEDIRKSKPLSIKPSKLASDDQLVIREFLLHEDVVMLISAGAKTRNVSESDYIETLVRADMDRLLAKPSGLKPKEYVQ